MTPRRTWPGVVFLVFVGQLVLWNGYVIWRNQREFEPNDRIKSRSGNIAVVAARNTMFVVRTTFATYHRMRLIAGKSLVISPERAAHKYGLERVSRLTVDVAPERIALPQDVADRLVSSTKLRWELEDGISLFVVEPLDASRYYLVEIYDGASLLLVPEPIYLRERGAVRP